VKIGRRADGYAEIQDGLSEGEKVVVSANFLIDAESNLQSALRAFTAGDKPAGMPKPEPQP
jgi:Cu(I)/Ag(I) efflux system membrane fusion protein